METGLLDKAENKKPMLGCFFYEFIGTWLVTSAYLFASPTGEFRISTYFFMWVLSAGISGAHFNPATTLAIFFCMEDKKKYTAYTILVILVQFVGSIAGVIFYFLIMKVDGSWDPTNPKFSFTLMYPDRDYDINTQLQSTYSNRYFTSSWDGSFNEIGHPEYVKICLMEFLLTLFFTLAVLIAKQSALLEGSDRIFKGLALSCALGFCYTISQGSGACMNPAMGIAIPMFEFILISKGKHSAPVFGKSDGYVLNCMWIYGALPIVGAIVACLIYAMHRAVEK